MADKKITDLTLRSDVSDELNLPSDDGIQSYRVTFAQIWTWLYSKFISSVTITATGTDIVEANKIVFLDPTGSSFTQNLPDAGDAEGWTVIFKNTATNGNTVTLDASGSELIDNDLTVVLQSSPFMDSVTLFCNGVKWFII